MPENHSAEWLRGYLQAKKEAGVSKLAVYGYTQLLAEAEAREAKPSRQEEVCGETPELYWARVDANREAEAREAKPARLQRGKPLACICNRRVGGGAEMKTITPPCEHKWVHLRKSDTYEQGYRRWWFDDVFFCEKCLQQKTVSQEIVERRSNAW